MMAANAADFQTTKLTGRLLPGNQTTMMMRSLDLDEEVRFHPSQGGSGGHPNPKLADASLLACRNAQAVLKREDSSTSLGTMSNVVQKEESLLILEKNEVKLEPGLNELVFEFEVCINIQS